MGQLGYFLHRNLSKKISFRNLEPMEIPKEATLTERKDINSQLNFYQKEDQVLLAVDCIIFGFDKENLKILLIKRNFEPEKGKWSLIGGFLKKHENLDQAAIRVLQTLTGLGDIYMEQLYTYSKVDRDPGQRTISVAYFAMIDIESHQFDGIQIDSARWFDLPDAPNLIFDHG